MEAFCNEICYKVIKIYKFQIKGAIHAEKQTKINISTTRDKPVCKLEIGQFKGRQDCNRNSIALYLSYEFVRQSAYTLWISLKCLSRSLVPWNCILSNEFRHVPTLFHNDKRFGKRTKLEKWKIVYSKSFELGYYDPTPTYDS